MHPNERSFLEPWRVAFERCFGAPADITGFESPLAPGETLYQVSYAPIVSSDVLGQMGHFGQSRTLTAHVASLGYRWDDEGRIRAAPTPMSFNALLSRLGPDAGLPLEYHREDRMTVSLGAWLLRYMRGVIPIHVCSASHYDASRSDREIGWCLTTLPHDLTVHALNYHLAPRACALELGHRIREALPERAMAWERPGATAPLTLAYFYDNDLNRYSYAVWSACTRPETFGPLFARGFAQLLGALEVRIDETRAGKGDVPDDDTANMPPLAAVEFSVPRGD